MILDLLESGYGETLNQELLGAVSAYETAHPQSSLTENYKPAIQNGVYLYPARYPLSNHVNHVVAELWLQALEENPSAFRADALQYVLEAAQAFIRGGSSEANKWFKDKYGKVRPCVQLGSFIVHFAFGLETAGYSSISVVDKVFDRRKSDEL